MSQIIIFTGINSGGFIRYIGPYQIAHRLRSVGYSVQVIEFLPYIADRGTELFLKILERHVDNNTLWIGFSTTFFHNLRTKKDIAVADSKLRDNSPFTIEEQMEIKSFVKSKSPSCKFVIGGARAWMKTGGPLIDCYIEGYADDTVIEFTRWCENKNPFLQYQKNKNYGISVTHDPKASKFDFTNYKYSWHDSDHIFSKEILPLEVSRGCIFKCSYCQFPLIGKKKNDYIKNPEILVDQLVENYGRFGTTSYIYSDDTHNDNVEKLELLYNKVYSKLPFKINFSCYMRIDLLHAHPHTIDLLKDSGLKNVYFGIESFNHAANKTIGKGLPEGKIIETLQKLRERWGRDVRTEGSFIIGLPNDSRESIISWMDVLEKNSQLLDSIRLHPLHINTARKTVGPWSSEFDRNPEKFGYTFNENGWINNTGFTLKEAWELWHHYRPLFGNKVSSFSINEYLNLGLSYNEVCNLIEEEEFTAKYRPLKFQLFESYIEKILK